MASVAVQKGLVGGPFGSSLIGSDYVESGIPVIRGTNMLDRYVGGDFVYVTREKLRAELSRNTAVPGDLVFTQRGTLGQVAMVPNNGYPEYVVSQSQMRLRVDPHSADPRFVFYACQQSDFLKQISDNSISTGVPHINLGILSRLTIPDLALPTQRAIADVLGALDDKIAANDRALVGADAIIRARYESLRGGPVPLDAIAINVRQQVSPAAIGGGTPYVGLEHVPRRSMWLRECGAAGAVSSAKSAFRAGDVLFGKLRPYFHKVVAAPFDGVSSTDILVVRAKRPELVGLVLAAASSDAAIVATTAASEGTRMPRTRWSDLAAVGVPWPGEDAACRFSAEVNELAAWAAHAAEESRALARTRDELLPLLMSGKLRVKDAEVRVEGVL